MMLGKSLTSPEAPKGPQSYAETLAALTAQKWVVVNEGPSGAQLRLPKKMRRQTSVALAIGLLVLLLLHWIAGAAIMGIALIDFAIQKEKTHFLSREAPRLP